MWGLNALYCNISVRDVRYQYDGRSQSFKTLSYNDSSIRTAKFVTTMADDPESAQAIIITLSFKNATEAYVSSYARQMSILLLSTAAAVFQPSPVQKITLDEDVLGSELQIVPLLLFLVVALTFWYVKPFSGPKRRTDLYQAMRVVSSASRQFGHALSPLRFLWPNSA